MQTAIQRWTSRLGRCIIIKLFLLWFSACSHEQLDDVPSNEGDLPGLAHQDQHQREFFVMIACQQCDRTLQIIQGFPSNTLEQRPGVRLLMHSCPLTVHVVPSKVERLLKLFCCCLYLSSLRFLLALFTHSGGRGGVGKDTAAANHQNCSNATLG